MKEHQVQVPAGKKVKLKDYDPAYTGKLERSRADELTKKHVRDIAPLAARLYAEGQRALLVILQGMDASGKDGTIRKVLHGVNPLSCQIVPFKEPTAEELQHDFLWRVHNAVPRKGNIGIFNRSHYEDVLIVRVKNFVVEEVWRKRYDHINHFEKLLTDSHVTILKIFLHISKDEQRVRLQKRLDHPEKRWKFRLGDLEDRRLWDEYVEAYEDVLTLCNADYAPWYIVPADNKWYRDLIVSRLIHRTLERMDPKFPEPPEALDGIKVE